MNSATIEYRKKVHRFLERMQPGERYKVAALATPDTRAKFLEEIKNYMRSLPYDGWISFNHDFTEFYKTPAVPVEQLRKGGG